MKTLLTPAMSILALLFFVSFSGIAAETELQEKTFEKCCVSALIQPEIVLDSEDSFSQVYQQIREQKINENNKRFRLSDFHKVEKEILWEIEYTREKLQLAK